jgi:molybdopterin-guanine dinucleotide biosynthesis protein A
MPSFDAIVLAGGSARRLSGADKPMIEIHGRTLLDFALESVRDAGRIVVVGPRRDGIEGVTWRREKPPGGGPVAALAAGLPDIGADIVVVLAADLPGIAPAVPVLLGALADHEAAVLSAGGRLNYLAAAWHVGALRNRVSALTQPAGASMRSVMAGADVLAVPDDQGWSADCDTWDDIERARG